MFFDSIDDENIENEILILEHTKSIELTFQTILYNSMKFEQRKDLIDKCFHFKHIQNRKEKTRFISCHFDENSNCVTNRKKYRLRMFEKWDNIVLLNEENGDKIEYVFLDLIEYEDEKYIVLLPVEDFDDLGEVVILRSAESDNDENESYASVEEEVTTAVFEILKEKLKSEFSIEN